MVVLAGLGALEVAMATPEATGAWLLWVRAAAAAVAPVPSAAGVLRLARDANASRALLAHDANAAAAEGAEPEALAPALQSATVAGVSGA
jgi:hypothetical protein